ncbi:hypothetical protein BV22DRAFT_1134271 [Leucogyrophana mollusca]|uniref:Uncharacterized protein n=1 Tax=Leucogyrophana mollusca TaxID=85980 RepID=A0ACB8AZ80_9AGAM|nr:hypothetical protein BV22DRAFT_1134271 [Leucogyrophana mollusca]
MDPISLGTVCSTVVSVATFVADKVQRLDKITDDELGSAKVYKRSLGAFSKDVTNIEVQLTTIVTHGNKAAVASLLDTPDGRQSLKDLRQALSLADIRLKKNEPIIDELISGVQNRRGSSHLDFVSLLIDPERDDGRFKAALREASDIIDDTRADLTRCFTQFCKLYEIHSQTQRDAAISLHPTVDRRREGSHTPRSALSSIQLSFYNDPFHVIVDESCALAVAEDIGVLTPDGTRMDRYTSSMRDMAERWVHDAVGDNTVKDIGKAQIRMIERLQSVLDVELAAFKRAGPSVSSSETVRYGHLADIKASTQKEVQRAKTQRFSTAFCGMVKAGKSLFLNALIGSMILPSDELPSTAWPCRVRHVRGQAMPSLEIDAPYFQEAIVGLQSKKVGFMMKGYSPPGEKNLFSALFEDSQESNIGTAAEITLKRELYKSWVDLHPKTKENLLKFEKNGYHIAEVASGEDHVVDLLAQVNDIVRLCRRFDVSLPKRHTTWPLLKIEFETLRNEALEGEFEFIDLPGIGESDCSMTFHSFEDLVRRVAKEVNAVVPVVSFKEVSKGDWKLQLPDIVQSGLGRAPDLVLCTHLDQVMKDRVSQQVASVSNSFWKNSDTKDRVLSCSSRMGFSARTLLRQSARVKPDFDDIWNEKSIAYHCTEKILGALKPQETYNHMSFANWTKALIEQRDKSGLQGAIKRIVTDMVISSHRRILVAEGARLARQLHQAISHQHHLLLTMHRSAEKREEAYDVFAAAKQSYLKVLDEWPQLSAAMQLKSSKRLQNAFSTLDREAQAAALKAIDNVRKGGNRAWQHASFNDKDVIEFGHVADAEMFLQEVQGDLNKSLSDLKRKFVTAVRKLANQSRSEHFDSMKSKIQGLKGDLQPELKEDIIEELSDRSETVEKLVFSTIRRKVMHTVATKHNAASAYRVLQMTIAKPLLKQKPTEETVERLVDRNVVADSDPGSQLADLGFMLRAPIAVIAAIPWLLGSPIWPFMKQSEKLVMNKEAFEGELKKSLCRPFISTLQEEAQTTLNRMMEKSSDAARDAVNDALVLEEQRYASERELEKERTSAQTVATALGTLLNLVAAEAAIHKLQECLKNLPPV